MGGGAPPKTRGFSEDLWDKFDGVVKKVDNGKAFTNVVSKFLAKQQQIESVYAKSMVKLCKDKTYAPDMEIGSLRDAWQVYRDQLEIAANQHEEFSQRIETLINNSINAYLTESKKQRKALILAGEKLSKDLKTSESNESKAKVNYEKLKKKQEEANEELAKQPPGAKEQKARKNLETATKSADKADMEYKDSVKQLQQQQQKFYHDEMPRILDDLQRFEVDRIDRSKDWLMDVVVGSEQMPPKVMAANENIRRSFESIDRDRDIQSFIMEKMSGAHKPSETQYEPYQGSNGNLTFAMGSPNGSPTQPTLDTSAQPRSAPVLTSNNNHVGGVNDHSLPKQPLQQPYSAPVMATAPAAVCGPPSVVPYPPPPSGSSSSTASNGSQQEETVRALYDYTASEDNEISFKANNFIKVLQRDESGWYQGTVVGGDGKVGMFPSNFIEQTATQSKVDVAGSKCKVLYTYHPDGEGEIDIFEGEQLTIQYEDEGWFFGTSERGVSGRFPSNYVQLIPK
ncbi:hypothetical protein SAMD00019534_062420 [Acytostelium subglobosum LB1]|uniref:hypothetical protein n=1 Tax=Acytostelium subglobosum LB1 TaxID=1410327 RepID=UPI0006450F44|nr:hypothetical protein SAMD00019534_062420 [Acytostelium subglobosum LB1]GAM23067.1 hypothetical protein SAMD00019534_062420 [Acytostelium subglobosum LB1]|eukprot:XP_012754294.1 hypothetical protein SAMD00019534_062420 [Acytostelium subglobosum LB1]